MGLRASGGLLGIVVWVMALATLGVFGWVVGDVGLRGLSELSIAFLSESPTDAGRGGGIAPILVSTGLILLVCLAAAVPIGVGAAALSTLLAGESNAASPAGAEGGLPGLPHFALYFAFYSLREIRIPQRRAGLPRCADLLEIFLINMGLEQGLVRFQSNRFCSPQG